jgi:1,4-dihydroxy-2-naphthoate octaprenyltransferase
MIDQNVVGVTRPNFLILTPLSILLGVSSALLAGYEIDLSILTAVLLGGVMAHVSVNALNEYADFQSGLDFKTVKTPFSGGSGTLIENPHLADQARLIGILSLGITILCGFYLVLVTGWQLIPIGLVGVMIILFYSGWINRHKLMVLISPGLGFGPLMVIGTHYAMTGDISLTPILLSLIPFFLVNNLLLVNQIPDIEADKTVGRMNYVITLKSKQIALIYLLFILLAYLTLVLTVLTGLLPWATLLALLPGLLTYGVYKSVRSYQGDIDSLIPSLGKNVIITLLTPALLTLGVITHVLI